MGNLVLSRNIGDKIILKDNTSNNIMQLTILKINKSQVKMSFQCPDEVSVDRLEIFMQKNPDVIF